jgi:hypothetical protein
MGVPCIVPPSVASWPFHGRSCCARPAFDPLWLFVGRLRGGGVIRRGGRVLTRRRGVISRGGRVLTRRGVVEVERGVGVERGGGEKGWWWKGVVVVRGVALASLHDGVTWRSCLDGS